jgi:shikimate dehydrogenase
MRLFGLIGYPLEHSFSKKYFTEKFLNEHISDSVFKNFALQDIHELPDILLTHPHLHGLCVTIPYKEAVIPFLDDLSEEASVIQAVNCIRFSNGKKTGFNTDYIGFSTSFSRLLEPWHKSALILGTGGASKACQYALQKLNIPFQTVSRIKNEQHLTYSDLTPAVMEKNKIIINCTPLGTYPNTNTQPPIPYHLISSEHYLYDLVYNPTETMFLAAGNEKGALVKNGYDMLAIQAEENWRIWNM